LALVALPLASWAQNYPTVTIEDIQTNTQAELAACNDTSSLLGDTVTVYGTVVNAGGEAYTANGRQIFIQEGAGPFQAIGVRFGGGNNPTSPDDIWNLVPGDSIKIEGAVERFNSETQLDPVSVELIGTAPVRAASVPVSDLNDDNLDQLMETGERWEGQYIEIVDVVVSSVGVPFSNSRQTFTVEDANGFKVNIADRFPAGRSINSSGNNQNSGDPGLLVTPPVGARFDTIRGVILHNNPSGCQSGVSGVSFGYELNPFDSDDIVIGASAPLISGVSRNPVTPNETQDVTISASIADPDGNVTAATIHYAVGLNNNTFLTAPLMDNGSGTYMGTIPASAYSNDDFVKYYVSATDDSSLTSTFPGGAASDPIIFSVRENGTTIYDVQFTPNDNGVSLYRGLDVTVEGVVVASAQSGDLGYVYIQEEGRTSWGGLPLIQSADLNNLSRGDKIQVTGSITENFGLTVMNVTSLNTIGTGINIDPVVLNPDSFTSRTYFNEAYEGMLVTLENPNDGGIFVVDDNADNNTGGTSNFAEYRVGNSLLNDANGCRVLAGRQTNSAFSSINVSYINDSTWAFNDGAYNLDVTPLCIVTPADSMASLTGIMTYSFGNMKLLPRNNDDFEAYSGANCESGIVSVEEGLADVDRLRAYPNPAFDRLTIEHQMVQPRALSIELTDLVGRSIVKLGTRPNEEITYLQVPQVAAGMYVLRVADDQGVVFTQMVRIAR